jgi:hypothetical protein
LGRLQQSETGPSGKPAQPLQQAAAGPLKSVMVNVKAQAAQAAMRGSPDAAAAGHKSAIGQRLSSALGRLKNESEEVAKLRAENSGATDTSSVSVQISSAARQKYSEDIIIQ